VQLIGVGLFSFIIGNVASLIANLDVARASYRRKVEEVTTFCRSKRIPVGLQTRILSYYEYMWERHRSILSDEVVGDLPHTLRVEVGLFLNREIIEKVSFFCNTSELFIREIIEELELATFLPNDFIIKEGEFGDCMYFVNSGQVDVIVDGQTVATLGEGAFFGEAALLKGALRNASVKTKTYCDAYRLSKRSFDTLRARYPEFDAHVQEILEAREKETASQRPKE
jgi:voltage-gated potassium channel